MMSQVETIAALAAMAGLVAAAFVWFGGALWDNLRAARLHRAAKTAVDRDEEADA
ncbi:MAG: hypothetical protein WD873_03235 [Candidatus Hydrogenedentales bacterium]